MASEAGDADARDVGASAADLWGRLCLPAQTRVGLPLGELVIRPRLTRRATPGRPLEGRTAMDEVVPLEVEQHPGVLLVESRMALGLVHAVLGLPWPTLAGPLTRIERGVLEGTVATALASLGFAGRIRLCGRDQAQPPTGAFTVEVSLSIRGNDGWACLMTSDEALRGLCRLGGDPRQGPTTPWLELASTRVPTRGLAAAQPGDKVVFDETLALGAAKCWPARLLWRGRAVAVRWLNGGALLIQEGPDEPTTRAALTSRGPMPAANEVNASNSWVEVSVGMDCASLVAPGPSPLVVSRTDPVVLRADGRAWGYGSVTETEGLLAVTITAKAG